MTIITAEQLENRLREAFPGCKYVKCTDESDGCGGKFLIEIEAEEFSGKNLLTKHRMVNKAIEEELKHIHAITIKAK